MISAEDFKKFEREFISKYSLINDGKELIQKMISDIVSKPSSLPQFCSDCPFFVNDIKDDLITTGYSCSHPIYNFSDKNKFNDSHPRLWLIDEEDLIKNSYLCEKPDGCPFNIISEFINRGSNQIKGQSYKTIVFDEVAQLEKDTDKLCDIYPKVLNKAKNEDYKEESKDN